MSKEEKFNVPLNPAFHHHNAHGGSGSLSPQTGGHAVPGNIARDGAPKRDYSVPINHGMVKTAKNGFRSFGGQHASTIDAETGSVVPVNSKAGHSTPGFGNAGLHRLGDAGGPLPRKQHMKPVEVHPSMANRAKPGMSDLGKAIIRQALSVAGSDHPTNMERAKAHALGLPHWVDED